MNDLTKCNNCGKEISISKNRFYKIKSKYAPFWFVEAVNQFENFNKIECPYCGNKFIAKEARLFFFFKSPYLIIILGALFAVFAAAVAYLLRN